ncbi:MAG TPA: lysozyme inhibitor LprI family protein [Gaiellaceae bacterium]|nr:lysozyme inhibitor LprI family protein [Gaiellaceae bacterium]
MRRILVTVAAAVIASPAAAAAAGGLAPPVIHEPFTPLPCPIHPDTTVDVEGCQEMRILKTDRAIDGAVRVVFRRLQTTSARSSFVAGEQNWLRYRRQSCLAEAARYRGGSAEPVAYATCTVRRNRSHLVDLLAMRSALARP